MISGIYLTGARGTSMQNNPVTTTLLHAILKNQHAIADALGTLADWAQVLEMHDGVCVADSVRQSLRVVDDSRGIIGQCISELMRDARH
jgi:hypothetical protein